MVNAEIVNITLTNFGLPGDFELFKKESKTENSKNDPRFKKLFKALIQNKAPHILKLTEWITYLKEHNYNADMDEIKQL